MQKECKVCGAAPVVAKGYCSRCYMQSRRGGKMTREKREPMEAPIHIGVVLPLDVHNTAVQVAADENATLSEWIRKLVERTLKRKHHGRKAE